MREFLKGANYERCKWLAVILMGISVIVINRQLESLPFEILPSAIDFFSGLDEMKLS
jgi:hypothetical protein